MFMVSDKIRFKKEEGGDQVADGMLALIPDTQPPLVSIQLAKIQLHK